MKKLFSIVLMTLSVVAVSQEVPTSEPDSTVLESNETIISEPDSTVLESNETIISEPDSTVLEANETIIESSETSDNANTQSIEKAENEGALETLQDALNEETDADFEDQSDMDNVPDAEESETAENKGPALVIGLGILPTHDDIAKGNISMPFRFSLGADNLFAGFGLIALYERGAGNGPYIDNDGDFVNNYARLTFGPTYRINKFRIVAAMDLFGPKGFFSSIGADDGIVGSGRKFIGVRYDVFKGIYAGLDYSVYSGFGVMLNYSIPLGDLDL